MLMCYQNQKYTKTTHLSSRTFAMGIEDDSWPACNRVKHLSFTKSTFEQKGGTKKPGQNKRTNEEPRCLQVLLPPSPLFLCSAGDTFPGQCNHCPLWASKEMDVLPENCRALENSQLWFLTHPTVLEMNCKHSSRNYSALDAGIQVAPGTAWLSCCKAVISALNYGGTNCSRIQGDAVTKSVLLPFFAAQGASIKFYNIVDYFLYMFFFFFLLDEKAIVFSLATEM